MEITHKKKSLVIRPTDDTQMFLLGRIFQKFNHLNWTIMHEPKKDRSGPPQIVALELEDSTLFNILIDSLDKFKPE